MASIPFVFPFVALDNGFMSKKTGNQRDSGLAREYPDTPKGNEDLDDEKKKACKEGNTELARLLEKEQKARGKRNVKKRRNGKHKGGKGINIILALLIHEIIRRF